jgi:transposase
MLVRNDKFNKRHKNKFQFYFTPLHASWVNQIEIFFSILEKRCLRHGNFYSKKDLKEQLLAFIRRWNIKDGHPFNWTFKGYPIQSKEAA